ncbi:MAG: copper amine oxidase N-terminal domain-containing protein [Clostridium sp.]|nr:copper amine oxidase N-terminal domain-containing protein [Clostridium sp.]
MKKIIAILLPIILLFLCCSTVLADTADIPAQQNIKVIVDGREITVKDNNGNPVGALIRDGVVYIPVAFIAEDIGYNVNWDETANTLLLARTTDTAKPSKQLKENAWNLTYETYYSYEGAYVSKQNEYFVYDEYFKGITDDGYVSFCLDGGYKGPHYENHEISIASFEVECSSPEQSYAPGERAKVTLRCATNTEYGVRQDSARVYFSKGNGKVTGDRFFGWSDGYFADKDGEDWTHKWNTSTELFGYFPKSPQDGDQIAIVFDVATGYDNYGAEYENNYGGHMFYEWIYTYKAAK